MTRTIEQRRWMPMDAAGLAVCALLLLAGYSFTVRPILNWHANRSEQQQQLAEERRKLTEAESVLAFATADVAKIEERMLESAIPLQSARDSNKRLSRVTQLAHEHGLQLNVVAAGTPRNEGSCDVIPLTITGTGLFPDCTKFINQLHSAFPDMMISVVDLADNPAAVERVPTFHFELSWYAASTLANVQN